MTRLVETKDTVVDKEEITGYSENTLNDPAIMSLGWKQFSHVILVPLFVTRLLLLLVGMIAAEYIYPLIDKK